MEDDRRVCVSGDPADARRHFSGTGGVKCATGHALVALQAPHGNSATDEPKTSKSIRHPHRIGTWNVRGLNQPGKLQTVENEMRRKNVHLLGLSETHWKGQGHCTSDSGTTVYFSGPEDESSRGVAFIVPRSLNKCVVGYNPVSDRIITLKLNTIPWKLNILQVYAPTAQSTEEEIEGFYDTLTATLKRLSKREVTIILGDFNAKVGDPESDDHLRRVAGKYGIGERNDRGERLLQFCCEENFTISNTCFKHHIRRLYPLLLKNLGQKGTKAITDICNTIWKTGKWPKDWTESVFIPLHKKGSSKDCGNYRTLALISHASKILLHVINRRLNYFLSRQIPEEQAGFVKGKGTREQILNVRQIIEKSREFNSPVILCFIDYTKAFDCVQWDHLWIVLLEMGVPEHLVALIQSLYTENRSFVRIGTEYSNMFQTKKGVRQGCILSPALFNIYGEYIIRKTIENWEKGFPVGGKRLSNLRYADDTVLLATSMEDMTELFQRLETESGNIGLAVNRSKTKVMIVDRAGTLANVTCNIPGINIVDHYIYLGSQICNDGSCVPEIKRRIGMAKDAMTRLNNIWKKRGIGIKTKIRLTRALVFPIFLYGVDDLSPRTTKDRCIRDVVLEAITPNTLDCKTHQCVYPESAQNKNPLVDHMPTTHSILFRPHSAQRR
ncbi:hypothetical protein B5X24_HaOG213934 [Helicoverpa armigera]|uniref:Reverse transcriptase domain-containing protein n=1 Tax=Helicoverpa armigera TaxID=29058 RepID=A0A2W1B3T2_HELAM|nr:hypothetical protein B5X24_HaOG213934 [Helicoverpa armigera]